MAPKPVVSTHEMLQATEIYLAHTENYEEVTLQHLAESLGVGIMVVNRWLPLPQWEQLRRNWIQSRLRKAIENFCVEGKTQEDFTAENIASYAGMPPTVVYRFFPEDEWQARRATLPRTSATGWKTTSRDQPSVTAEYVLQAEKYVALTEQYEALTMVHFAEFLGVPKHVVHKRLPVYQWEILRNRWIESRLRRAMDAAYAEAKTQNDFTEKNIAKHAAMPYLTVQRFLSEEDWRTRRATLPTTLEQTETTSRYLVGQLAIE